MRHSPNRIRGPLLALLALLATLLAATVSTAAAQDAAQDAARGESQGEDAVVLRVGDEERTLGQFDRRFEIAIRGVAARQGVPMSEEVRTQLEPLAPRFLEQRARELAWLNEAEARGLVPSDAAVDEAVAEARGDADEAAFQELLGRSGIESSETLRALLAENETIELLRDAVASDVEVGEEELREAYDAQPDAFATPEQVCARHVLVETPAEAESVLAELESGTDFATVAAEYGSDATAQQGGELGCIERGQVVPAFEDAVFDESAPVGEPFGPIETDFGQHVVLIEERIEAEQRAFDEVRAELRSTLAGQKVQAELDRIAEQADVETYPGRLPYAEAPAPGGGAPAN